MKRFIIAMTLGISMLVFNGITAHADNLNKYPANNSYILELKAKSTLIDKRKERDIMRSLNKIQTLKNAEIIYARSKTKAINSLLKKHKTKDLLAQEKIHKSSKNIDVNSYESKV